MKDIWLSGFEFAHAGFSPVFSGEVRAAWEGGHQSCVPPYCISLPVIKADLAPRPCGAGDSLPFAGQDRESLGVRVSGNQGPMAPGWDSGALPRVPGTHPYSRQGGTNALWPLDLLIFGGNPDSLVCWWR
jgi:hypothetical protein